MSQEAVRSTSPQHPSDVVGEWPATAPAAMKEIVDSGREAARAWARVGAAERAAALRAAALNVQSVAADLADLAVREVGKPLTEARAEVARTVAILEFYAQAALDPAGEVIPAAPGSLLFTQRRPRGLVGLIAPWNFPFAIPTWKLAPAIAWGNAAILKPAPDATACALRLAEVMGLPDGVLQVAPGGADAGRTLVDGVDAISFTGSAAVGQGVAVAAAGRAIPVQAEMGGQNPCVVLPDADVEATAAAIAASAMGYAGQKCTAARRVITVGPAGAVTDALVAQVERLTVGDPADAATVVGPLITEAARDRVAAAVNTASSAGARVLTAGQPAGEDGWFFAPTLVDGLDPQDELATEEVFGPVCAILPARDLDEAVRIANGTRYGLVAAVYTRDLGVALDVVSRLEAGLVRVNAPTTGVDYHAPFGGEKASSIGPREQGRAAREFFTTTTTVTVSPPAG